MENMNKKKQQSSQKIKLYFHRSNGPADKAIKELMDMVGGIYRPEYVREMIIAALKAGQEDEDKADLKLMNTTLKEMRFTAKIFGPYRGIKKVTVFGSARVKAHEPVYDMARILGKKLKEAGYMVITGGGPGIMQAANEGAGPDYSFGINIKLPFEQKANPVIQGNSKSILYKYFFNRKVAFIKEAHAVVLFPGGFGTLDEAMETMTLIQTGKRDIIPLVLIEPYGTTYWQTWMDFLRTELLDRGYIKKSDFSLFELVDSPENAVERINLFYRRFHSLRYVNGKLVIRMTSPLSPGKVSELNSMFPDILEDGGKISLLDKSLPEEANEPHLTNLPRLIVDFNKRSFSRLKQMIDAINRTP